MLSKREQDRIQALKLLEERFIVDQLTEMLYLKRKNASGLIGNDLLGVVVSLGVAAYAHTGPSREQVKEKIKKGLLDNAVARERFKAQFNHFINDLSSEEKDKLISSQAPITQVVQYYVARNSHIALSDSIVKRYQAEERTAVGQDRLVVQQNIAAAQGIRQAAAGLPKILPTDAQLRNFNGRVNQHRKVLESNKPADAKMLAAIAIGSVMAMYLAPLVALAAIAIVIKPSIVTKSRFFLDAKASNLPTQSAQLVQLGGGRRSSSRK